MKWPHCIAGLIQDFRELHAKLNPHRWIVYRDPISGRSWFPVYSASGAIKAEFVQYEYREPMDIALAMGGDLEAACLRGFARKRTVTMLDLQHGLVTREELSQ